MDQEEEGQGVEGGSRAGKRKWECGGQRESRREWIDDVLWRRGAKMFLMSFFIVNIMCHLSKNKGYIN